MGSRVEDITQVLNELAPLVQRANGLLSQERVSYELIRGDIESALLKKKAILDENENIKQENERAKGVGVEIINSAKNEAKRILDSTLEINVSAIHLLDEVKEFCRDIDKKRLQELKKKVNEIKIPVEV